MQVAHQKREELHPATEDQNQILHQLKEYLSSKTAYCASNYNEFCGYSIIWKSSHIYCSFDKKNKMCKKQISQRLFVQIFKKIIKKITFSFTNLMCKTVSGLEYLLDQRSEIYYIPARICLQRILGRHSLFKSTFHYTLSTDLTYIKQCL